MWCIVYAWVLSASVASEPPSKRAFTIPERRVWDVVRSSDGDFAFSMPVTPARESRDAKGAAGPIEILAYSCTHEGADYRLRRVRAPEEVPPGRVIAELDRLKRRYLTAGTRLIKETPIVADGVIGEDITYTPSPPPAAGPSIARTRHFVHGHFYYALTVTSPPAKPLSDDANRFLSSLTFEAVVRAHYARMKGAPKSSGRAGAATAPAAGPRRPQGQPGRAASNSVTEPRAPRPRVPLADATPEDALRTFLLALAAQDAETLRSVTRPDDELPRLLRGRPASSEDLARMRSLLEKVPMRRLKAGDTAPMPDGTSRTLRPDEVRTGRVVLRPEGAPYATPIEDEGGHWKIVPRPFITARKSAESGPSQRQSASP